MRLLCFLIASLALNTATANVFQCTDARGNTVFTDQPCKGDGQKIEIDVPESKFDRYRRERKEEKARLLSRIEENLDQCGNFTLEEIKEADYEKVGMTEDEVQWVRGRYPDRINQSAYGPEQWVYKFGITSHYVYIENGCVVNWQR